MASVQSVLSTPKQGSLTYQPISKISFKAISKSKCSTSKMSKLDLQSSNLAHSKLKHKNEKIYQIVPIRKGNSYTIQNNQSIVPLGQLHVDQLTDIHTILERRIEKDYIELRLSPSNFLYENTGSTKTRNLSYKNHILQFYNYLPQQTFPLMDKKKFEDNLSLPFECVNLTYQNEQLLGISKKMNYDFIRLMGINLEIIDDYISNHSQLPECWNLNSLIMMNNNIQQYIVEMINYQGERFQAQIEFKKFLFQCKNNSLNEYSIYMIVNCDRKQFDVTKIEQNYLHYFEKKELAPEQFVSIHKSRILKECLIKPINTRFDL